MSIDQQNILFIETDTMAAPVIGDDLYSTRGNFYRSTSDRRCEVAIIVPAYNNFDKTKLCIENILKYSDGIDFELFLIDNGSESDMLDFFNGVAYKNKTIMRVTKNVGLAFAIQKAFRICENQFIIMLSNDVYLTKNALHNMLACIKSDPRIGFVSPMSSNCSNLQNPGLTFHSLNEMQEKAAIFNKPDPQKWQERLRLLPIVGVFRKELIDLIGVWDSGFYHDFLEDDFAARVRRAGFKMMLCGDSFVHHDHIHNSTPESTEKMAKSLEAGRSNFQQKYHGLDAWDDVNNLELGLTANITKPTADTPTLLGLDVRCGSPILEIRNKLRTFGVFASRSYAFTTQAKYFSDLQAICEDVKCDRIDFLSDYYTAESFDYILLGESINAYHKPLTILQKLYELLKPGGTLLYKLRNTSDLRNMLYTMGNFSSPREQDMPVSITVDDLDAFMKAVGMKATISTEQHVIDQASINAVKQMITAAGQTKQIDEMVARVITKDYLFCVRK